MTWKTPITLLVLLGLLLAGAYVGWQSVTSSDTTTKTDTTTPTAPTCTAKASLRPGQVLRAKDIVVNTYNASNRSGLAGETLDALVAKGFKKGAAENAPDRADVANVTIWTDEATSPSVLLVAKQFRGKVTITAGDALAPGVVILLGDNFTALRATAPLRVKVRRNTQGCTSTTSQ